jgi:O-antigen/teichoic acid export membrane protein
LPLYRRRGQSAEEREMLALMFGWNLIEALVVSVGVVVFLVFFADRYEEPVRQALYFLPFLFAGQKLLSLYPVLLRSSKEFRVYATTSFVIAQLDWLLVAWAWFGGLFGLLLGSVANSAIKLGYYHRIGRPLRLFSTGFRFELSALRAYFPYAPRYALFKGLFTVIERVDSLFVASVLGPTALGYYYLGARLASAAQEVPNALVYVAYPNLMESLAGSADSGRALATEFDRFIRVALFLLLPIVISIGYFGSEIMVRHLLPAFVPGVWPIKIVMLSVGLQALRQLYYRLFMVRERVGWLTMLSLVYFPAFLATYFAAVRSGSDALIAVAIANLVGDALSVVCLYAASRPLVQGGAADHGRRAIELSSHLLMLALIVAIDVVSPAETGAEFLADTGGFAVRLVLFGVVALSFAYVGLGRDRKAVVGALWRSLK